MKTYAQREMPTQEGLAIRPKKPKTEAQKEILRKNISGVQALRAALTKK